MDSDFNESITGILNESLELHYETCDENEIIFTHLKSLSISL